MLRPIRIDGDIAHVALTQGYEAIIDSADVVLVDGHNWTAMVKYTSVGEVSAVYALRNTKKSNGKQARVWMHRLIAGTPSGMETDHIDGDGLNNRRGNLRHATKAQNTRNRRAAFCCKSGVKGVFWHKASGKWSAQISVDGAQHYLGVYDTLEAAAEAYAKASRDLHGDFGRLK